ncbi:hypothetical protein CYMTET_48816 [Cymbomonas tetramitiformis]|uniref:EGF-like domain-containing protein n=1 Tax=Cymbomonas tetramitiformis TaxID=36881 RepID=A0AAE0EVC6_9CHLO|nr:hypothetical protein CYMTET_48816 [Cymbomonas tetramitiformis]
MSPSFLKFRLVAPISLLLFSLNSSRLSAQDVVPTNVETRLKIHCGRRERLDDHGITCPMRGGHCAGAEHTLCPKKCSINGTCNEELGRCDCVTGMAGAACDFHDRNTIMRAGVRGHFPAALPGGTYCLNACSEKGRCTAGVCQCDPGFFGMDCSLFIGKDNTTHLLDHRWHRSRPSPRVYVYELPPEFNAWFDMRRLDRPLELFFVERLLTSHHRTANPEEADLFVIPIATRLTGHIYGNHGEQLIRGVEYVQQHWPELWARNEARDHVIFFSGDWGPCELFTRGAHATPLQSVRSTLTCPRAGLSIVGRDGLAIW